MDLSNKMFALLVGAGLSMGTTQATDDAELLGNEPLSDRISVECLSDGIDLHNGGCGNSGCGNGSCK